VCATLDQFIASVNRDHSLPASDRAHAIGKRLQAALADGMFYVDCARVLLGQLVSKPDCRFLFIDPEEHYTLQVFCWPIGFGNDPHRHDNWTVSGVMMGSLLVFRSAVSETDCVASKPLVAAPGQVGVLVPPQFHRLRNIGRETAITFHVFSLDDAAEKLDLEGWPTSAPRFDDEDVLAITSMAVAKGGSEAISCVRTAFSAVGPVAKLELLKLMIRLDPTEAIDMGRTLSRLVGGLDGRRLLRLVDGLDTAASQGTL
jgi:predicted metal-dependent enzyme (double-stranded beta helix superfamily)